MARYLRRIRRRGDPRKRWLAFLHNHREAIVAFDFFTVPTVTFRLLYCFLVIEHGGRKILDVNVTRYPTASFNNCVRHSRKPGPYRHVIFDRDRKFDAEVIALLKATGLQPRRKNVQAPWQNCVAERWIGSCRREVLEHVLALNEQQLRRLIREYVCYYARP